MKDTIAADTPVVFAEHETGNGLRVGVATLNTPKSLNGLSLEMARLLNAQLARWSKDPEVAVVVLQGAGEKAFCAGGDLHGLYQGMRDYQVSGSTDICDNAHARDFFEAEYRLDYRIHTFPKPVLCWGHGIVMGGGIGLMAGASHRVVSDRSKLAFPEITVGLFPDVAGSWLLNRVPDSGGIFLALTGAPLNASDAIHAGLADHFIEEDRRDEVLEALLDCDWSATADTNRDRLTTLLQAFESAPQPGPLQQHRQLIASICAGDDLIAIASAIERIELDDRWLQNAKATLAAGAPGSVRLGFELQQRAAALSLADTFRLEYIVALHCAAHGDFAEGIRALLIDKDRNPRWSPATLADSTPEWAESFFTAPWSAGENPLDDLDRDTGVSA